MDKIVRSGADGIAKKFSAAWRAIIAARGFIKPYADIFYFLFLAFLIWCKSTYVEGTADLNTFFLLAAICLAVKCVFTDWTVRDICIAVALVGFGFIAYRTSGHSILLVTAAGIVGAKDVDFKGTLDRCCIVRIALYIAVVAFANMKIIPSDNLTYIDGDGILNRYTLGFTMPNAAHILFLVTVALYIAADFRRFGFIHAAVVTFLNIVLYNQTGCRTGVVILEAVVILALAFKIKAVYRVVGKAAPYIVCGCAFISVAFAFLYGRAPFVDALDNIISNRFLYSQLFIDTFGLSLLGTDTSALVSSPRVMDVAYINLVVNYGVIAFALFIFGYALMARRSVQSGNRGLTLAIITMAVLGLVENYILDIGINFTLMFIAEFIFARRKGNLLSGEDDFKGSRR